MIGWIVEKTSRSGWRQKWRRFRIVTTAVSVTLVSAASWRRCVGAPARAGTLHDRLLGHGSCGLRFAVLARRLTGQLQEHVVERRPPQAHVADADPGAAELRGGLLDQHEAIPRRRQGQPVRPPVLLRSAAADAKQRRLCLDALLHVGQLHLEDLAADAVLELAARPFCDHPAVVDHRDLVGELVCLFEVLRRQQDRRSLAAKVADDLPDLVATARIKTRRRLVEEEHTRLREQAGRQVESPSHPARVRLCRSVSGVGELEALEQLRRSAAGLRAREPEQAPEHLQVLAARQQLVDRRELTGQRQQLAHARRLGDDVAPEQLCPTRIRHEQRRQDADERRLARPVRAKQAEDHPLRDHQVDAGQRSRRPEPLDHARDADRGRPVVP